MMLLKLILFVFLGLAFSYLAPDAFAMPALSDDGLVIETFTSEFGWGYTTMTFVDDDILLLEKDGSIRLIRDGELRTSPVYDVRVDPVRESGLLGITSVGSDVYLYFTSADESGNQIGNRIYKYMWDGETLTNPVLLYELPSNSYHNSRAMVAGLDGQVYAVIGDTGKYGPLQNKPLEDLFPPGTSDYLDTSVILNVDPPGDYHAIGIRNSFGLAIDPVTGNLWATENGDDDFDEVNLVEKNFNSGWERIMGPATEEELDSLPPNDHYVYSDPEFSWQKVVAPTGIEFGKFNESRHYDNSVFVGDCNNGNLYKFSLNESRTSFEFESEVLSDNLVNLGDSMDEIVIGTGFKCITDIERGPDGYLYIVSYGENTIYRILPKNASSPVSSNENGGCLIATAAFGSELAPQVQQLRELRDNTVLQTSSGAAFMTTFNQFYYQ